MDDRRLTDLLRTLETEAPPRPAFADELFGRLQAEARPARPGRVIWTLAAAALLVVALGASLVAGGVLRLPITVMDPSPSALASPRASESAGPTSPSPAPSEPPGPVVERPGDVLPLGATFTSTVELQLRTYPGPDAPPAGTVPPGTPMVVIGDPVRIGDALVYAVQVADPLDGGPTGAVALDPASPEISVVPADCPDREPAAVTIEDLVALSSWARLACFGDVELTFEAWAVEAGGSTPIATYDPDWLANPFAFVALVGPEDQDGALALHAPPDADPISPIPACEVSGCLVPVRVTGHFDDPRAAGCSVRDLEVATELRLQVDPAHARVTCRQVFVVTEATIGP